MFLHLHYLQNLRIKIKMKETNHILMVDDDPDLGMMIKQMLEYKGFSVTLPARIERTEEILHSNNFDLVIMDMLLSGVNGIDICKGLKDDSQTAQIPVM